MLIIMKDTRQHYFKFNKLFLSELIFVLLCFLSIICAGNGQIRRKEVIQIKQL